MNRWILFGGIGVIAFWGLVAALVLLNPFGQSMSERVSADVGASARCREAGYQWLVGEREKVWTCTYRDEDVSYQTSTGSRRKIGGYVTVCVANIEGRLSVRSLDPC